MTNILKIWNRLSLKSFWILIKLCFSSPLYVFPTISATKKCMVISTKLYGREHYKNGPANAFRHAFWNYLIAKKCFSWKKKVESVLIWTKKITDWHEAAFPNRALARKMDLHNNEVGRFIFKESFTKLESQVVDTFREMTLNAVKIGSETDLALLKDQLVYIIEDK